MKAFPKSYSQYPTNDGMDLRDYFAAKVLPKLVDLFMEIGEVVHTIPENAAETAYKYADAMMKARSK